MQKQKVSFFWFFIFCACARIVVSKWFDVCVLGGLCKHNRGLVGIKRLGFDALAAPAEPPSKKLKTAASIRKGTLENIVQKAQKGQQLTEEIFAFWCPHPPTTLHSDSFFERHYFEKLNHVVVVCNQGINSCEQWKYIHDWDRLLNQLQELHARRQIYSVQVIELVAEVTVLYATLLSACGEYEQAIHALEDIPQLVDVCQDTKVVRVCLLELVKDKWKQHKGTAMQNLEETETKCDDEQAAPQQSRMEYPIIAKCFQCQTEVLMGAPNPFEKFVFKELTRVMTKCYTAILEMTYMKGIVMLDDLSGFVHLFWDQIHLTQIWDLIGRCHLVQAALYSLLDKSNVAVKILSSTTKWPEISTRTRKLSKKLMKKCERNCE